MNWTAEKWCEKCGLEPTLVGPMPNAPSIELHRCLECGTMYQFDTWTKAVKEYSGATTH